MKGRLQFKYDEHLYSSKADIVNHIQGKVKIEKDKCALFAEPIVFKYGEDNTSPNIVLAIGAYGNGTDISLDNKYFLIDSAQMEQDIEEIREIVSGHSSEIQVIEDVLVNAIDSIGLTYDGKIDKHDEKHHIWKDKYLGNCDDILCMLVRLSEAIVAEEENREETDANLEKEISDRTAADEAEATARMQGDIDDRNFAYNLYNEKIDNAIKVENIDERTKEISLKIWGNDTILEQDTYGLKARLKLNYDDEKKVLQLIGKDGQLVHEISAEPFIKDGFLETSDIVNNVEEQHNDQGTGKDEKGYHDGYDRFPYICLKWKNGTEVPIDPSRIPLNTLTDIYTAGNGLDLTNYKFSIKLDPTCEPFLSVGEDGLKLSGINVAIEKAMKSATTKIEKDVHAIHLIINSREEADGSKTYILDEDNIASNTDLQEFKTTIRGELESAITELNYEISEKIVAEEEARTVNDNVLRSMIALEEQKRIDGDRVIKEEIIGTGIEGQTLTAAIIANKNNIAQLSNSLANTNEDVDRIAQKLDLTYHTVTANTESIDNLKNIVGEGIEGGETLTHAIKGINESVAEIDSDVQEIKSDYLKNSDKNEIIDKIDASEERAVSAETSLSLMIEKEAQKREEEDENLKSIIATSSIEEDVTISRYSPFYDMIRDMWANNIIPSGTSLTQIVKTIFGEEKRMLYYINTNEDWETYISDRHIDIQNLYNERCIVAMEGTFDMPIRSNTCTNIIALPKDRKIVSIVEDTALSPDITDNFINIHCFANNGIEYNVYYNQTAEMTSGATTFKIKIS